MSEPTRVAQEDQVKLMRLRVELYAAAQLLKGDALEEFKQLIHEVVTAFDIVVRDEDDRPLE